MAQKENNDIDSVTKEAGRVILLSHIRVMRSDLKFGKYSPAICRVIEDKLQEAIKNYNALMTADS